MLLAIGAVHQRLVQSKQRVRVGLVAEPETRGTCITSPRSSVRR